VEPLWNWEDEKIISVNAFSNSEEVELFLNGKSLGSKKMTEFQNRTITWEVPFAKGTLRAVAINNGKEAASYELKTTEAPTQITVHCDKTSLKPDRQGLAHIFVTICDEAGNTVYSAENEITCEISGPVHLLGMDDSNPANIEDYKDNKQKAFHGKLLIYLQSIDKTGPVTIKLSSPGLQGTTVALNVVE
jgi:hypothetical protein